MIEYRRHIVIIDDGVDPTSLKLLNDLEVNFVNLNIENRTRTIVKNDSHGTICANIINKFCKSICNISSIKILDSETKRCRVDYLCSALNWCLHNNVDIINLSAGSVDFRDRDKLLDIVNKLEKKNIIIVCAESNDGVITYPAYFSNTIGTRSYFNNKFQKTKFIINSLTGIQISTNSSYEIFIKNFGLVSTGYGNSFSSPYVVALICNLFCDIDKQICCEDIRRELFFHIEKRKISFIPSQFPDWIMNATVLSTEKELPSNIQFNISSFIIDDSKWINKEEQFILIQNDVISDTVIFIFTRYIPQKEKKSLINCAIECDKNIVLLDEYPNVELKRINFPKKICYSFINFNKENLNYLYNSSISNMPIVLIIGNKRTELLNYCFDLQIKMKKDGFNMTVITNDILGILINFLYYKNLLKNTDVPFDFIGNYFSSDIILISIYSNKINYKLYNIINADLIFSIFFDKENNIVIYKNIMNNTIRKNLFERYDKQHLVDTIYNYILSSYENINNDI